MPFPAVDLYPSTTLFPGASPVTVPDGVLVTLNGQTLNGVDPYGVTWYTVAPIDGWDGSVASSMQTTQKTRAPGAWTGPRELTPRSIGLTGYLVAASTDAAVAAMDRLNAAAALDATILTVQRGSDARSAIVYRQGAPAFSEGNGETIFGWTVDLIAPDPRKFATALNGATGLPSTSGGILFPIVFPVVFNATVVSGRVLLNNPGNAVGPVTLRIDGPVVGPQVTHVGTGRSLVFGSSLTIGSGEWLEVDMEAQIALANGQSSRNAFINSRQWFGFEPGDNTFAFSAVSGAGLLTVTATPAWQ